MSAEVLREAARLMRDRTDDATPGPWECHGDHLVWPSDKGPGANDPIAGLSPAHEETAEHIASWHPGVALAVADLLDLEAAMREQNMKRWNIALRRFVPENPAILAVARAYLGGLS